MTLKQKSKILTDEEKAEVVVEDWDMPYWKHQVSDLIKTNAIGWALITDSGLKPPPKKKELVEMVTPEKLKEIQKQGYKDGFKKGKELGIKKGIELGREEGKQLGHDEGVFKGREEGFAQGQVQIDERCKMWEAIINQLEKPLRNLDHAVEQQLIQLAIELARQIIFVEVTISKDVLYSVLREGIRHLPVSNHGIDIRLNPEDVIWLRERYSEEECERRNWHIKDDADVPRGDVHLVSDMSSLHLDLRERIENMLHNFMRQNLSYMKSDTDTLEEITQLDETPDTPDENETAQITEPETAADPEQSALEEDTVAQAPEVTDTITQAQTDTDPDPQESQNSESQDDEPPSETD